MIRTTARHLGLIATLLLSLVWTGCARTDIFAEDPNATPHVVIEPAPKTIGTGKAIQFTARVAPNSRGETFEWSVDTEAGGTVTETGIYTAPSSFPDGVETNFPVVLRAKVIGGDLVGEAKLTIVPDNSPPAVTLEKVSGDNQSGTAGAALPLPFVVKAVDEDGNGVEGVAVRFNSPLSDSEAVEAVTDETGQAQGSPKAGAPVSTQAFLVTSPNLNPIAFSAVIAPGPLAVMKATHPAPMGPFNSDLPDLLTLTFSDEFGNRLEGHGAVVSAPGNGFATAITPSSNGVGVQQFRIHLATLTGPQDFIFADSVNPSVNVKFTFTATGGAPTILQRVSGDGQTGTVAQGLAQPFVARVLDQFGVPVAGVPLTWSSLDGGTFGMVSMVTDSSGLATAPVVLGTHAGPQRFVLDAGHITNSPMTFVATAKADKPTQITLAGGANQTTGAGAAFGTAFSVLAMDAFGNPAEGTSIHYEVLGGGGSVSPTDIVTGADGLAQARMFAGANGGDQLYRASSPGVSGSPIDLKLFATPGVVYHLEIVSGNNQKARAGTALPQPLVIRVTDGSAPAGNQTVTFGVALGGGAVAGSSTVNVTTGADGLAQTTALLGSTVGPNRFSATLPGADNSPLFFDATAEGAAVATLRVVSGNGQTGLAGSQLAQPLVVEALDVNGQVVPGVTVTFSTTTGGSVSPSTVITDAAGLASTFATLSLMGGDQDFIAAANGITATFRASAITNGQVITLVSGDGQQAVAGTGLPQPFVVRVSDANANPVAGVTITWAALDPGASVSQVTVTTDSNGLAQVSAKLGSTVGTQQFTASTTGAAGSPVTFTAVGTVGPATQLVIFAGNNQTGSISNPLPAPLVVKAIDAAGNPVAGVSIDFTVGSGGGTVLPASGTTSADGTLAVDAILGPISGTQTFIATATGLSGVSVTFTATATKGTVVRIEISPLNPSIQIGATTQFAAVAFYSDGSTDVVTEAATWSSNAVNIATISDNAGSKGIAIGQAGGNAIITAAFSGHSISTTLSVRGMASLVSINITPVEAAVIKGGVLQFTAIATYSDNTTGDVTESATWSSTDITVASVSDIAGTKGLVSGVNAGTVTVKATVASVSGTRTLTVVQSNLKRLEITPAGVTKPAGIAVAFTATATFENGTVQNVTDQVTWASSNTAVVTIQTSGSQVGRASLVAAGSANVTATFLGQTATAPVVVTSSTLASINVTPRSPTLAVNDFIQYTATAAFSDGTTADVTTSVTWSSSAPAVASISNAPGAQGVATALSAGNTTLTATLNGISGTASLTVDNAVIRLLWISQNQQSFPQQNPSFNCNPGQTLQLRALAFYQSGFGGRPADISDQVSWTSSNTNVASVAQGAVSGGLVTCIAAGTVTVRASFSSQTAQSTVTVSNATVTSVSIAPSTGSFGIGDSRQFFATARYSNGQTVDVSSLATWQTANSAVATVSNATGTRGLLNAVGAGTTSLTATFQGVTGTANITVSSAHLSQVIVTPANPAISISRQRRVQFTATALYDDGTQVDITTTAVWASSNTSVATMDTNPVGRATLQSRGTSTISASYSGFTGNTTLTVF